MTVTFSFAEFWAGTGLSALTWQQAVMIGVACLLIYFAIAKEYEPLLLLPIAFGMLLANLPLASLQSNAESGLLHWLYQGVKLGIYPPLIFLGIGCMTDFSPADREPQEHASRRRGAVWRVLRVCPCAGDRHVHPAGSCLHRHHRRR